MNKKPLLLFLGFAAITLLGGASKEKCSTLDRERMIELAIKQYALRDEHVFRYENGRMIGVYPYNYESVADFVARHPNCCEFHTVEDDPESPSPEWTGIKNYIGFVLIRPTEYLNADGSESGHTKSSAIIRINECGEWIDQKFEIK